MLWRSRNINNIY
jgi:hypothetical protein